jgi:hypothetical protein
MLNGNLPQAYLVSDIVSVPEKLISNASLIKGKSEESLFIIYSTHYIDKEILCKRNNYVYQWISCVKCVTVISLFKGEPTTCK